MREVQASEFAKSSMMATVKFEIYISYLFINVLYIIF